MYQLDVSVWVALDLMLATQVAQRLVLEPATEEDLETDVPNEPGALVENVELDSYRLVIQCKLRSTGPWKHGDLSRVLAHGTRRKPARKRLEDDPRVRYLLVSNADVDGVAHQLKVNVLREWPPAAAMPAEMGAQLVDSAPGRVAILASLDAEKLDARTQKMLTERFRLPWSSVEPCREKLRHDALRRMRGAGAGVWTRQALEDVIIDHGGCVNDSTMSKGFVPPTNWNELVQKLATQHAIIITGPSGTGKTKAAKALLTRLRAEIPGVEVIRVDGGPEKIEGQVHERPVAFEIEDPWGKFRLEPGSAPWNDAINGLLRTAGPNRKFVITSRSDVLSESGRSPHKKWVLTLNEENYGPKERKQLFENMLQALPRAFHATALRSRHEAVGRLLTPMEMERYFDTLEDGPENDETEQQYHSRCIADALQASIERAILNNVRTRGDWRWAAVTWGLFKARARQSFNVLPSIQSKLTKRDPAFEDGLEPYLNFLVAGRNLRQVEASLSYQHPRVELGLQMALNEKPELSSRALRYLVETLTEFDADSDKDWGREGAAHLVAACRTQRKLNLTLDVQTQARLDDWIRSRLAPPGPDFEDDLALAAAVGSQDCISAELARWLRLRQVEDENWFLHDWCPEPVSDEWYRQVAAAPATGPICEAFIRRLLPHQHWRFPSDFAEHIGRLAPGLGLAFRDAALSMVRYGHISADDPVLRGALTDLPNFEPVVDAAVAYLEPCSEQDDDDRWLRIANGEYGDDAEEYMVDYEHGLAAEACLQAYVKALRLCKGWTAIREHRLAPQLLYSWLVDMRDREDIDDAECEALAQASADTPHEALFWTNAIAHWRPLLAPFLLKRISKGCKSADVRLAAARVLAHHPRPWINDAIKELLARRDERRVLELALDLNSGDQDDDVVLAATATQELVSALPDILASATLVLLEERQAVEVAPSSLTCLRALDARDNYLLRLAQAEALSTCNIDVADLLANLLEDFEENSHPAIKIASHAVELAIELGLWHLVETALHHRFADVRERALVALADRAPAPLPDSLIAFVHDRGSRVRKALLKIFKARPHPGHIPALLKLAGDTWSRLSQDYENDVNYPIAVGAARCLWDQYRIDDCYVDNLLTIAQASDDGNVGRLLLAALLRRRVDANANIVVDLALSGTGPLHRIAANSLLDEVQHVSAAVTVRIDAAALARQPLSAAIPLAGVVGAAASPEQVVSTAQSLAVDPVRCALLIPIWRTALARGSLAAEVAKWLPPGLVDALASALDDGPKLPLDALNELGDMRVVEAIKYTFRTLFAPDPSGSSLR
jgi:SpoVK/Ycf46/Vps4 family AAA+-type ATPase